MAITINGPIINGEETLLTLYNPEELRAYPHWDRLLSMANDTFGIYHKEFWDMDATGRFTDNQSFINELEPEFFTFVFTGNAVDENGASRVYGTASARTLVEHTVTLPDYASTGFLRDMKHIHGGIEAWELKILAVDPSLYRSGIGSMLQDAVEAEVKKRVTLAKSEETKGATQIDGPRGITFMLTTVAEVNEEYYIRKGYRTTQSILLKVGGLRNIKECHIVHMEKVVDL